MTAEPRPLEVIPERPEFPLRAAVGIVGSAVLASFVIPGIPVGLGTSLVAIAVTAAIVIARPVERDAVVVTYAGLALGLAAMPTFRAADWLIALDLLAAAALGTLAVTRAVAWSQVFHAPLRVLANLPAAGGAAFRPLRGVPGWTGRLGPAVRGLALGGALLIVFGTLFATADPAFAELAGDLFLVDLDLSLLPARILVFGVVLLGTASLALAGRRYSPVATPSLGAATRGLRPSEWVTALGLLDLLFALFVAVQITVLFGGRDHVLATLGLTYAEYARQGFFQLLAVGALTFAVVAGAVRWARRESTRDTRLLQLLLGVLCVLAVVVLISALRRLSLYEAVFGYTRLRISVHATILWMAALFVLLLVAGVTMRARWVPSAVVILSAVSLLGFSVANPDLVIAERNVDRFRATGQVDLPYLAMLSPDAVPALTGLPAALRTCALWQHAELAEEDRGVLGWNLGRTRAADVIPSTQPGYPVRACRQAEQQGYWT